MKASFTSCLFTQLTGSYVLHIYDALEGLISCCCFVDVDSSFLYASGVESCYCLPSASVNLTICAVCRSYAYWGGRESFTSYSNNNSHLLVKIWVSCCYLMHNLPDRDDVSCFFQGSSCTGPYPVDLHSDISGCIMSKYNFVNNSDSSGYFLHKYSGIASILTDSVIAFTSPASSLNWIYYGVSGSIIYVRDSIVIAAGPIPNSVYASITNVVYTDYASTLNPFKNNLEHMLCVNASLAFTFQKSIFSMCIFLSTSFSIFATCS